MLRSAEFLAGNQELMDSERIYRERQDGLRKQQEKLRGGKKPELSEQPEWGVARFLGGTAITRSNADYHTPESDGSYVLHGSD